MQFKGKMMYLTIATGWTMSFYLIQILWENIQLIVVEYREFVAWYILLMSLISFVIAYRFGPVTNVRTKKLIQWFLQVCRIAHSNKILSFNIFISFNVFFLFI